MGQEWIRGLTNKNMWEQLGRLSLRVENEWLVEILSNSQDLWMLSLYLGCYRLFGEVKVY